MSWHDTLLGREENNSVDPRALEASMTIQPNYTVISADRQSLIGCYNQASANAYSSQRLPSKVSPQPITTVACVAYVSPTGQYYVQHGTQRIDVANIATARYYVKHGLSIEV